MSKRAALHAIFVFVLILSILPPFLVGQAEPQQEGQVNYDAKENKATVGSNGYVFSFIGRGNTPFYRFSDPADQTYRVKFMKLIEFADEDGDGTFNHKEAVPKEKYALPSADWSFTLDEDDQTFTFSAPESAKSPAISLVNHYDIEQPQQLKFDIQISNWAWQDASNMLALQFDVLSENDPEIPSRELENGVELGENAYFESALIAKIDGDDAPVGISVENKSVFLAYSHFDLLEHDPLIGFSGAPEVTPEDITVVVPVETSMMIPGVIGGITTTDYSYTVLIATALLIMVVYSRRR